MLAERAVQAGPAAICRSELDTGIPCTTHMVCAYTCPVSLLHLYSLHSNLLALVVCMCKNRSMCNKAATQSQARQKLGADGHVGM